MQPAPVADATADFYRDLNDPRKWVVKQGVPLFKAHQRTDPATGKQIVVDHPKLYRIAANMTRLERDGGVPVRATLGHTDPAKSEVEQPPVAAWYRNARVQPFGPSGELAVVADEWLDPQYADKRKNYPYRSAEYYDDAEQITGVALLTRDPFLDLGTVAYSRECPGPVRYSASGCVPYLFLLGDREMYPPHGTPAAAQPNPAPTQQPAFQAPAARPNPVPYAAAGVPPFAPSAQLPPPAAVLPPPLNYGYASSYAPPAPYGDHSQRADIGHSHANQSWSAAYAEQPGAAPGMGMPGEEEDDGLSQLHYHLQQAAHYLGSHLGRRGAQSRYAPEAPAGVPGMAPPAAPPGMPMPGMEQPYGRYAAPAAPTPYAPPPPPAAGAPVARTISGLPVGYQAELDRLAGQVRNLNQVNQVLLYEREQADTQWCYAEIRRLADAGFQVGEYELHELKAKPRGQARTDYINHIETRYASPSTVQLPPLLNDPTAEMAGRQDDGRPATQEEMEAALKLQQQSGGRMDYGAALQAARYGQRPATSYGNFPVPYEGNAVFGVPEPSANGVHAHN